jgi:hypothetical protein
MLRSSGLIGCDYKMMCNPQEKGPCLALYSPGGRVTSRFRERVHGMYSFLSEYFSTVVLAPHAIRYRAAQVG